MDATRWNTVQFPRYSFLIALYAVTMVAGTTWAWETATVTQITVEGARRVPADAVRAAMATKPGHPYSHVTVGRDIQRLFQLHEFSDVCLTARLADGCVALDVAVTEQPTVTAVRVAAQGVSLSSPAAFELRPGRPFSPQAWQRDVARVKDELDALGYHSATLAAIERRAADGHGIALEVNCVPGPRQYIERIEVYGNSVFTEPELAGLLHCRARNVWRFRSGSFRPRAFDADVKRITDAYLAQGCLDVSVELDLEAGSAPGLMRVVVRVIEGPQYLVGREIWTRQTILNAEQLRTARRLARVEPGTPYGPDTARTLWQAVSTFLEQGGLDAAVTVRPIISSASGPDTPEVDLLVSIEDSSAVPRRPTPLLPFAPTTLPY
jgi:outer membrane protein insertion porin family